MALTELVAAPRDGTSRAARLRLALGPTSAPLDERGLAEHLAFAKPLSAHLVDVDDEDRPRGDWWPFLAGIGEAAPREAGDVVGTEELAAWLADPSSLAPARARRLQRPHLTLFWTFLRMLDHVRDAFSGITARHLDHHFRDVLRVSPAPAVADEIFVLLTPVPRLRALALPAGLRLAAGRDSAGRARAYALTGPVTVTHARIAQLRTLFLDKEVVELAEARSRFTGTHAQQILFLLTIALGEPRPGDPLPPGAPGQPIHDPARGDPYEETYADAVATWLAAIGAAIGFAPTHLHLAPFELRQIVALKSRRAANTAADIAAINAALEEAGRRRTGDPNWRLPGGDPANFAANLQAALGGPLPLDELPDIDTPEQLAAAAGRAEVKRFFAERLPFFPIDAFTAMMARKVAIDSDWRIVNSLLQEAARRRLGDPSFNLPIARADDFATNLQAALGGPPAFDRITGLAPVADIDGLVALLAALERWFGLPAEAMGQLVSILTKPATGSGAATAEEWEEVYAQLGRAHAERSYAARRQRLAAQRKGEGLAAALATVTGEAATGSPSILAERAAGFLDPGEAQSLSQALSEALAGQTPSIGWPQVDALLERAQRRRERLPTPVPRRETSLNLYARSDATGGQEAPWPLFGGPPADRTARPEPLIGWAVGSPLLALGSEARRVVLTLTFRDNAAAAALRTGRFGPFRFELSTAEGWFAPADVTFAMPAPATSDGTREVRVTALLAAADPPLAPPPAGNSLAVSPTPVARLQLEPHRKPGELRWVQEYDANRGLRLARLRLDVEVAGEKAGTPGLHPLSVETDVGPVDGRKPFLPFGAAPGIGARLNLGHPELLGKPLTRLTLRLAWLGAPTKILDHFKAYGDVAPPTVTVELVDGGVRATSLSQAAKLFDESDAANPVAITLPAGDDALPPPPPPPAGPLPAAVQAWPRYLRLTLTPRDFQHAAYPVIAALKAVELAKAIAAGGDPGNAEQYVVPPPYTPRLKLVGLGYRAGRTLMAGDLRRGGAGERLYHLHPFGHEELEGDGTPAGDLPFLPAYDEEGELYLGIEGALLPQGLPVLVALAPGSGDLALAPPPVRWSVLAEEGWVELAEELAPEDGTAGLVRTGIITFALPAVTGSPRLPPGLLWLRVSVARDATALGQAMALHPHAARARLVEEGVGVAPDHYAHPLPPETVKGPVAALPGLAAVRQPYPSFGGQPAEDPQAFATRVAERLRHKGRALTAWDYEHLVLARFPDVYKAKCLPARGADPPGLVRLVVIPDLRGSAADPLRPRATPALVAAVHDHLAPLMPAPATLEVRNPRFVEVKVRVAVRFRSDRDPGFDRKRLEDDINGFLSPWAQEEGADIVIGRRIYANSLVAFIDGRNYVDFVAAVRLFTSTDGGRTFVAAPEEHAEAEADDAILTAAARHEIDLIGGELDTPEELGGIGYMRIELDFRVAEAP